MFKGLQISRLRRAIRYLVLAAPAAIAAVFMLPVPAAATITGPCSGVGQSYEVKAAPAIGRPDLGPLTSKVDFRDAAWLVPSWRDYLQGNGLADDGAMASGEAYVLAFGLRFKVAGGSGSGDHGSGSFYPANEGKLYLPGPLGSQPLAAIIFISGSAQPDPKAKKPASAPCDGHIVVRFMDVSPVGSVAGELGLAGVVLGGIGLAGTALRRG